MGAGGSKAEKRQLGPLYWKRVEVFNDPGEGSATASDKSFAEVAQELEALMQPLVSEFVHENLVDYNGIAASPAYATYREFATSTLRGVTPDVADEKLSRAFFINLYNMLTMDAMIQGGVPPHGAARLKRWSTGAYRLGEYVFSLNDVENGTLRGNQASAVPGTRVTYEKKDPKKGMVLPLDRRIHFALNCGAISCPPVRVYSGAGLDAELDQAAKDYLTKYLRVLPEERRVKLTRLAAWFEGDFGEDDEEVLKAVQPFAQGEVKEQLDALLADNGRSVKLEHYPYSMDFNGVDQRDHANEIEQERVAFDQDE